MTWCSRKAGVSRFMESALDFKVVVSCKCGGEPMGEIRAEYSALGFPRERGWTDMRRLEEGQ